LIDCKVVSAEDKTLKEFALEIISNTHRHLIVSASSVEEMLAWKQAIEAASGIKESERPEPTEEEVKFEGSFRPKSVALSNLELRDQKEVKESRQSAILFKEIPAKDVEQDGKRMSQQDNDESLESLLDAPVKPRSRGLSIKISDIDVSSSESRYFKKFGLAPPVGAGSLSNGHTLEHLGDYPDDHLPESETVGRPLMGGKGAVKKESSCCCSII